MLKLLNRSADSNYTFLAMFDENLTSRLSQKSLLSNTKTPSKFVWPFYKKDA